MSNLAALNNLRAEAKALGMTGYGRMKFADLSTAVDVAKSIANEKRIDALREEAKQATPERREDIIAELARMGAVLFPQGTTEHEEYRANLSAALKEKGAWDFLDFPASSEHTVHASRVDPEPSRAPLDVVATPDAEVRFAEAVDADDTDAMKQILEETAPVVIARPVRDPNAIRYEDLALWTDERLDTKEDELVRRLARRTLLGHDRKLTESRLARVKAEIESRSN